MRFKDKAKTKGETGKAKSPGTAAPGSRGTVTRRQRVPESVRRRIARSCGDVDFCKSGIDVRGRCPYIQSIATGARCPAIQEKDR